MARKKSGGFGKVLNFIGLVDDEDPRDYENEYQADNYGRQQPYVPQRAAQQRRQPERRQEMTPVRRYPAASYEPTRTPRMDRSAAAYDGRFDARASSRTQRTPAPRRDDPRAGRFDYSPRPAERSSRFGSLNGQEAPASRFEDDGRSALPVPRTQPRTARQRTVMFALHSLEDCCDVIDNLIMNNTVILTLDDLEPKLMQRAVDTLSGAVFALHATIRKASDRTYLIAPNSVEVNENDADDRFF